MANNVIKQWVYNKKIYIIAFAVPFAIMYFVYAAFSVHPFGDNSVLVLDLNGQYVYYYEALRDALWGDSSLIYSWSRNLSGEMFGIFAYYLASPFTIIPMLLPRSMILGAIEFMQLVKIGTAAVTFALYLKKQKNSRMCTIITFATLYSLMSYCVVQLMNPMWIDGLIYLPLIIMGLERLIDKGKMAGFIIPLALMFIANFYIGYMVGFFAALYFVYYVLSKEKFVGVKNLFIIIAKTAISVIIAVMCAMVILLPVYNSLKLGKFEFTEPDFTLKAQFTIEQFFTKLLPFSYDTVRPEGLPIVYCGAVTLLLIPLYFLNKNIKIKNKIANASFLAAIFLCMYLSTIDIAWHGFQVPNWLPYRYSFVFCFIMLIIAAEAFENLEGITFREIAASYFAIILFLFYVEGKNYAHIPAIGTVLLSVFAFTVYFIAVSQLKKRPTLTNSIIVFIFVCVEMFTVSLDTLDRIDNDVVYSKFSSYQNYIKNGRAVVDTIEEIDKGLYRSEKTFHRTVNDPMAFGLKGISHSSSTMNSPTIELLRKLGFSSRGHYTKYNGATEVTDAIFGIKYILNQNAKIYEYNFKFKQNGIEVYENPNALSIGYMVNNNIRTVNINDINPFENQNDLINGMIGTDGADSVFKRIYVDYINYENITVENAGDHIKFSPTVQGLNAHVEYRITAPTDDIIYVFFPSNYERTMNLWVNNEFISVYYETDNYCIMPIGKFNAGEIISIITTPTKEDLYMIEQCFYYLDKTTFDKAISQLKENQWNITKHTDTYLEGEITAQENQVMFTSIPYEKGWTIKVDGRKVEPVILADALIGINVPEGTHTVTMKFMPNYFITGIIISCAGVILLIGVIMLERRSKRKTKDKLEKEN